MTELAETALSIDEVFPRHKEENPFHYTQLEKAERVKAIRDMAKDYPNLPGAWLDMAYDFCKNTPKEEMEDIINSGKWEKPGRFSNSKGGVLYTMEILDPPVLKEEVIA